MKFIKIILLIAIFGYIFYDFNFSNLDFSKLSIVNIIETILILFIGQLILGVRFMKIIDLPFKNAYETIVISNALNMFLPARMGEIIKAVYLNKFYNYQYNKGLSAVFVERFFDVVMLLFVVLIWGYFYFTNETIKNSIIILTLSVLFIVLFFNSKFVLRFIPKFLLKFYLNINKSFKQSHILIFWSFSLWVCYLFSYWSFFDFLTFSQILELFIFSTIALSIPLAPAGIGTFEGIIVFYLGNYGINKEDAFLFASLYHFLIFIVDFMMFYLLLLSDKKFKSMKSLMKKVNNK